MRITRLIRIIAVVLALAMLPLWLFACSKPADKVSDRLVEMMIGKGKVDDDDEISAAYLAKLDAEVEYLITYYGKEGNWDKAYMEPGTHDVAQHYVNVQTLTTAWATKGSEYYRSTKVMSMIKKSLEFGYETLYGEADKADGDATRSWKERADIAESLVRTLLILRDKGKISKTKMENYISVVVAKYATPAGTGVDLARSAYIVLGYAALLDDEANLQKATEALASLAVNVTNGVGLYTDGSFVADTKVAASGSYGIIAFSEVAEIAYAVRGEAFDFPAELLIPDYLYNWAVNSIMPSLYNGRAFAATTSSFLEDAEELGGRAVSSMLVLAKYFEKLEDEAKANELRAVVKGYGTNGTTDFATYLTTFGVAEYEEIREDKDLVATNVTGVHNFTVTDKLSVMGTAYSASLSLSSTRTAKYETRNNYMCKEAEDAPFNAINGDGWYTGDGMLMVYTTEYAPDSNYWKYVKSTRLPGTTVDSRDRDMTVSDGYRGSSTHSGSVTDGTIAVSSFLFINNNSELTSVGLTGKKSWFFLDGEIIGLGAGINNPVDSFAAAGYAVETIVENVFCGTTTAICTTPKQDDDITLSANRKDEAPEYFYILGYGGIYVPKDRNDTLNMTLNVTDGGNFIEVWLDHSEYFDNGTYLEPIPTVVDASYEYCIVPSTAIDNNMNNFFAYAQQPGYTVLANTTSVQAVKDASSGVEGYVFWEAGSCSNGAEAPRTVTVDFACNLIIKETDTQIIVTIADPNQISTATPGHIDIGVAGSFESTATSAGLSFSGTTITVDRTVAASGASLTITINK